MVPYGTGAFPRKDRLFVILPLASGAKRLARCSAESEHPPTTKTG